LSLRSEAALRTEQIAEPGTIRDPYQGVTRRRQCTIGRSARHKSWRVVATLLSGRRPDRPSLALHLIQLARARARGAAGI